ncbi:gag/pol protein [Cucumis melo var. makuwa]|uniref:Gag/pol protein n=1 Tax=Cucumis melo var. makuwa TaxID=1194695 RepID=A0A5A7VB71_CUCMM|nr:gag/pol protein [Cucumis melo var. makuwa]
MSKNYATWKSNLNMILVIDDLYFVLMEEYLPFPSRNASQIVKNAYDRWTKANDKARVYLFFKTKRRRGKRCPFQKVSEGFILRNKSEPSSSGFKKTQKKKGGKGKRPTVATKSKEKAKVVDKDTSSLKQLNEGEMTLKVGTGDVISARVVGDARYGYLYLMEHKSEALEKFKEYKPEVENLLIETAVHILNNVPSNSVSETLFELWRGRKSSLSHFRIWGSPVHVLVTNPKKLEPCSSGRIISQPNRYLGLIETRVVIPVWVLVNLPEGVKPIGCKWIYKRKRDSAGKKQVCKLNQSLYGLKQASRSWKIKFDTAIKSYIFYQNVNEPCVYKKINEAQFQMKDLEEPICSWDLNHKGSHGVHFSKEQCSKTPQELEDMRRIPYVSAVGSLMYVMICTRPDICYAIGIVTMDLILTRYTDSDFQTNKDSRKSTLGSVFTLNGGAVVWRSIKQGYIVDSTMEAEYVAACEARKEVVWLRIQT